MKKKFLAIVLAVGMALMLSTAAFAADVTESEGVAYIQNGNTKTYYTTLDDAVNAAVRAGKGTVYMYKDYQGAGIGLFNGGNEEFPAANGVDLTIDFGGNTFTCVGPAVGSEGTKSQAFHLEKGNTVTLQNGTVTAENGKGVKMMIQNYCDLTLKDLTVTSNTDSPYAVSNNFGSLTVTGATNINAKDGGVAFDLWYGLNGVYLEGVKVTFDENFTGAVKGKMEYGAATANEGWTEKTVLTIQGGSFEGEIVSSGSSDVVTDGTANIVISGGNFKNEVNKNFVAPGYICAAREDEAYSYEVREAKTFTLTYNTNGGNAIAAVSGTEGEAAEITLPTADEMTREGYTFAGWFTDAACETEAVTTITLDKDYVVYAKWSLDLGANVQEVAGDPEVGSGDGIADAADKAAAVAAAASVELAAGTTGSMQDEVKALYETVKDGAEAELKAALGVEEIAETITVYMITYVDIQPTSFTKTEKEGVVTAAKLVLDVTPKCRIIASTAATEGDIKIEGDETADKNAVVLTTGNIGKNAPTTLTVTLPAEFQNKTVWVLHKRDKKSYEVGADGKLTFDVKGFSPITFSLDEPKVSYGGSIGGGSSSSGRNDASYTLTFDVNGGSAIKDITSIASSTTVKLSKYTPTRKGYTFDGWYADKDLTEKITSVKMTESKTVYAKWIRNEDEPTAEFNDVADNAYYAKAVAWAVEKNVTKGISDTSFAPNKGCTRAEAVTFLWRAAGEPTANGSNPFADVASGQYYEKAVLWAVEQGITNGISETAFAPNQQCTRGEIVTFLGRLAKIEKGDGKVAFVDVAANAYYADAVAWAVEQGITNGTSETTFAPNQQCSRGEIVTFLYRYMNK